MDYFSQIFEKLANWWFDLNFTSIQKRALLSISAVVVVISVFIVVRGNTDEVSAPAVVVEQVQAPEIFVDVTGAVNTPGVYTLAASSRVIDAIKAAGGSAAGADLSTINLARVLADGEQIYVDAAVANSRGVRISTPKRSGPININRATVSDFDSLDGIGPVIARRIVEYRKIHGPFITVEDLQKVSGIGDAKFAQIKNKIRV
ncbi:MAG: ComEA family DNA-binding protein [Actinomycetales bacterium]|nr:ComEA family DNA-binding protein [Actinomycetales bacterium]